MLVDDDQSPTLGPRTLAQEVLWRLEMIEHRLKQVQGMSARAYESLQGWADVIANAREGSTYGRSFEGEPLVSVRVATYNQPDLLCNRALASLQAQSYENWEALVVGDQCTDDTADRVAALGDTRISFTNRSFRGPYPSDPFARWSVTGINPYNDAIEMSRGEWIAALDHDDSWDVDHLATLVKEAKTSRAEVVYARIRVIDVLTDAEVNTVGAWPPVEGQFPFLAALVHGSFRELRLDPNAQFAGEIADWNFARRLWEAGARFHFVDRVLASHYYLSKISPQTIELQMINDLRGWCGQLEEARDHWRARAEAAEAMLEERSNPVPRRSRFGRSGN